MNKTISNIAFMALCFLIGFFIVAGTAQFQFAMDANDEPDQLFLIRASEPLPEPTSLLLLGTGLGVTGLIVWRSRKE